MTEDSSVDIFLLIEVPKCELNADLINRKHYSGSAQTQKWLLIGCIRSKVDNGIGDVLLLLGLDVGVEMICVVL